MMLAASMEDKEARLTRISSSVQPFQIATRPAFTSETVLENKVVSMASKDCSLVQSSPAEASLAKPAVASAAKSEGIVDAGQAVSNIASASDSLPCTVTDLGSDTPVRPSTTFGNSELADSFPAVLTYKGVSVSLENNKVWQQFFSCGTEMILTKQGRRMFPYCRYRLTGLDPEQQYKLILSIDLADQYKYRWNSSKWEVSGKVEHQAEGVARAFSHHYSPSRGATWMGSLISFYKLKLTNGTLQQEGHVVLHSMHRYIPRLHVIPVISGGVPTLDQPAITGPDIMTFTFPQTEFMAVTTYQNFRITQLKINHNPFAKGFRDVGLKFHLNRVRTASHPVGKEDLNPTMLKPAVPEEEKSELENLRTTDRTNSAALSSEQDASLALKPVMLTSASHDKSPAQPAGSNCGHGELMPLEKRPPLEPNNKNGAVNVISKLRVPTGLKPFVSPKASSARYCRRRKKKNRHWGNSQGRQWKAMAASPTLVRSPSLTVAMQPELDDVEGLLFVSFISKEALDVHVGVKPSSGPSCGRTQTDERCRDEGLSFISRTGKTNDVTKIKGWQNKFVRSSNASLSKCDEGSNRDQSAFCSNMLDEYLESEGQQIAERAAAFSTIPEGPVAYWLPDKSASYVKTLDSALKHRSVTLKSPLEGNTSCPLSDKSLQCSALASSAPSVDSPEAQSHLQPSAKLPDVSERSPTRHSRVNRRRGANFVQRRGNTLRPQKDYKSILKLQDIEMETASQGLNKSHLTRKRLSASLSALQTATNQMMPHQVQKAPEAPPPNVARPICGKQHCNLGCVCSSIECAKREVGHCRHPECMFDYVCLKVVANMDQKIQPNPVSHFKKLGDCTTDELDPEPLHIPQCGVFAAPMQPQTYTPAMRTPAMHNVNVIREEDKDPVYKYLESLMTCARVRAFKSKPPSEATLEMKYITSSTLNAKTLQKASGNLPKTYRRTLLAVKKPAGSIPSGARIKKQIEIQSGCKWNQDREMILEALYQRMNEGRLSQRFCMGPYYIRPVTRIFMRKPSGSILTYRVHISKPGKGSDDEDESVEENGSAEDDGSDEQAVQKYGVIPFLSRAIPAGTLRANKKPVGCIGTGLIQVNGKSYNQAKLLLGNMGSLHPANRLAAYVTGRINAPSSISLQTSDFKNSTNALQSHRVKTTGTVIPPVITARATTDHKAPNLSPVQRQPLIMESSSSPQHLQTAATISFNQHNSVNHRLNGSMPSPVSQTASLSLKTPSFLGESGTYSFRICPPTNQGNTGGSQKRGGVTLPGGFTIIQLPKPGANCAESGKTKEDNGSVVPLQIALVARGYSVGKADNHSGAANHAITAAKNQSDSKPVDAGSSPELVSEEKMPADEKNETKKQLLKSQEDSYVDVVSEDLTSDGSDYSAEDDGDQTEEMVDIETVEEESQQMVIAKLREGVSMEQGSRDSDDHCGAINKVQKQEVVRKKTKIVTNHTMLERIRRSEQRDLFERLQKALQVDPKASRHYLLASGVREIRHLVETSKRLEQEKKNLAEIQATYLKKLSFFSGKSQNLIKQKVMEICKRQKMKEIKQSSCLPVCHMPHYKTPVLQNTRLQSVTQPQPDRDVVSAQTSATQPMPLPHPVSHMVSAQNNATQPIQPPQPVTRMVPGQNNAIRPIQPPQHDPDMVPVQTDASQHILPPEPDPHVALAQTTAAQPTTLPQPDPHVVSTESNVPQPITAPQPDPHVVPKKTVFRVFKSPQTDVCMIPVKIKVTGPITPSQTDSCVVPIKIQVTAPLKALQTDSHVVPVKTKVPGQLTQQPHSDSHAVPTQTSGPQPTFSAQPDPDIPTVPTTTKQTISPSQPDLHMAPTPDVALQETPPSEKEQAKEDSLASVVLGHNQSILEDDQEVPEPPAQITMPCSPEVESQSQTPSDPATTQAQDSLSELSSPVQSNKHIVHLSKPVTLPLIRSKTGRLILPSSLKPSGKGYYAFMLMNDNKQGNESKAHSSSDADSTKNQETSLPEAEQILDPETSQNAEQSKTSSLLVDQTAQSSEPKPKGSEITSPLVKLALLNQSINAASGALNPQDTSKDRGSMTPEKIQNIFEGFKSLEESKKTLTQMQSEYMKEATYLTGTPEKQLKPKLKELCDWQKQEKTKEMETDFYFSRLLQEKAALVQNSTEQSKAHPQSDSHKTSTQIPAQKITQSLLKEALSSPKEHLQGDALASVPARQSQPLVENLQEASGDQAKVTMPDFPMENNNGATTEAPAEASPSTPLNTHTVSSPKSCTLPLIRSKTGRIILPSSLKPIGQGYYTLIVNKLKESIEESEVTASPNPTPSDADTSNNQDKSVCESNQTLDSENSQTTDAADASSPHVDQLSKPNLAVQTTPLAKLSFLNQSGLTPSVTLQPLKMCMKGGGVAGLNKTMPTACLSFNRMNVEPQPEHVVFRRRRGRPRKCMMQRVEACTNVINNESDTPVEDSKIKSEHETFLAEEPGKSGLVEVTQTRAEDSSVEVSEVDDSPVLVKRRRGRPRRIKSAQLRSPTATCDDDQESSLVAQPEHSPSKSSPSSERLRRYLQIIRNRDTKSGQGPTEAVLLGNMNASRPLTRGALGKDFPSAKKRSWVDVEKELDPELDSE